MNEIASIDSCINILVEENAKKRWRTQRWHFYQLHTEIKKRSKQLQITCMLNNIASFNYILATKIFYVRNNQKYTRPIDVLFHIYLMLWFI